MEAIGGTSGQSNNNNNRLNRRRANLTIQERSLIKNVYEGIRARNADILVSDAVEMCSSLTKVSVRSVYRAIKSDESVNNKQKRETRGRKKIEIDDDIKYAIRRKIDGFYCKNEIPTLKKIATVIAEDEDLPRLSRRVLIRTMQEMNFRYLERNGKSHAQNPAYPMYNSPMNSISSPQQSSTNQVAPPSPLDVSVPRPSSQTGNVAYPSVITRALNPDKTFPERYERSNHNNQQNQNCWDERQGQRKFQNNQLSSQTNNFNANSSIEMNRGEQNQQRIVLGVGERQQSYFETNSGHQVMLQDLSSCRDDPTSIIKNFQQQQSNQVQQPEIKTKLKPPIERKKSSEKPVVPEVHIIPSRISPPAHSSGANQPQQNGASFTFTGTNYSEQLPQASSQYEQQQQPEGHPKVVVPNIEEELNFLSQDTTRTSTVNHHHTSQNQIKTSQPTTPLLKPPDKGSSHPPSFMSSFMKFLQGKEETLPPLVFRGGRKQSWLKAPNNVAENKSPESNGVQGPPPLITAPPPPAPVTRLSQGDPQDDPRYIPLPKERKRNSFDSFDDGLTSEDHFYNKKTPPPPPKLEPKEKNKMVKPKGE